VNLDKLVKIFTEYGIIVIGVMRGITMIALVNHVNRIIFGQVSSNGEPIIGRTI
jgi:hypothetical protein